MAMPRTSRVTSRASNLYWSTLTSVKKILCWRIACKDRKNSLLLS